MEPKWVSIWYDPEGDFLEVVWQRRPGEFVESADGRADIKLDDQGNILGFQIQALSKITNPTSVVFESDDVDVQQCRKIAAQNSET